MVRTERLELSRLAAPDPKSGVSANSTTPAISNVIEHAYYRIYFLNQAQIHSAD